MGGQCKGLRGQKRGGEPILSNKVAGEAHVFHFLLTVTLCTLGSLDNNTMVGSLCTPVPRKVRSSDSPVVTLANRSASLPSSKPHAARLLQIIRESGSHRKKSALGKNLLRRNS